MTDLNAESPVHALVQQREQLRGWIAKLEEVGTGAPARVAERIRQDYGDRLARVTAALGEHREEIGRSLESMRLELREVEERHTVAGEALEEMRIRHLIGELGDSEWETQRGRLDVEVASADAEMRRLRGEVDRLASLAAEVSGDGASTETAFASAAEEPADGVPAAEAEPTPEPAALAPDTPADEPEEDDTAAWLNEISLDPPAASAPAAPAADTSADEWDPFGEGFGGPAETRAEGDGDLPWLETPERAADPWSPSTSEGDGLEFLNDLGTATPPPPATGDLAEDDLAFLEELDRAISASPAAGRPATPPAAPAGEAAPVSGGPLLCKECGAINEPHSWYCEICGSEL
jgi:hypothetical protein